MAVMKTVSRTPKVMMETAITVRVMPHLPIRRHVPRREEGPLCRVPRDDISSWLPPVALIARKDLKMPSHRYGGRENRRFFEKKMSPAGAQDKDCDRPVSPAPDAAHKQG